MSAPDLPSPCPCCGAYSLLHESGTSTLLAVCDVLVVKALEKMGNWIVRAERCRYRELGDRPLDTAHTIWRATDEVVSKALRGAWDVVPPLLDRYGCCDVEVGDVTSMLDGYVHDLVVTGTAHSIEELAWRFTDRLGLPVYLEVQESVDAH